MSASFSWSVVTPDGTALSGTCEFLVVPTTRGELGILADHAPLAASVAAGSLRITSGGTQRLVAVGAGIVEVLDNGVRLFVGKAAAAPA